MSIEEFFQDYRQDLLAQAGVGSNYIRSTFVEKMCAMVEAEGAIPEFTQTDYKHSQKGLALDAWAFDPSLARLTLFVTDFRDGEALETLTQTEVAESFKRLERLVQTCHNEDFVKSLDESMPVAELAWFILEKHHKVKQLVLVVLSNAKLSSRVTKLSQSVLLGLKTSREVWDFERIYRIETSGRGREDIEVDFSVYDKKGIACLPAHQNGKSLRSYLLVLPGTIVARLYEEYGERLLEQNVRTFLQFRGNINKGMRNTLVNEPHMFFSYNNGLSATAEEVTTTAGDTLMLSAKNLQIVNGGQTTASIFTAETKEVGGADLSQVYVQVKLTVVAQEKVDEVVPRISEFSNTQNKVSAADFFSNHPFHRKIEEFSRRIWAPSSLGHVQQTHWFYERARGQFMNKQAGLTAAEKRRFLLQNPKSQMFTKTDLAKYVRTFDCRPHEVSKGAQKNFSGFAGELGKQWEENEGRDFTELWFQQLVAKAILFRDLDAAVHRAEWYAGYKANIVTYALAKFADMIDQQLKHLDFLKIWGGQMTPEPICNQLLEIAEMVNAVLTSPPSGATSNVTEWAKNEDCWKAVTALRLRLDESVSEYLIDHQKKKDLEKEAGMNDAIQDGIKVQTYVLEKGAEYWCKLREWNDVNHKLTAKEVTILELACKIPRKFPSDKQSPLLIEAEKRALAEGFFPG
jgi:hypothetical protein